MGAELIEWFVKVYCLLIRRKQAEWYIVVDIFEQLLIELWVDWLRA